jgi:hypothetical protein
MGLSIPGQAVVSYLSLFVKVSVLSLPPDNIFIIGRDILETELGVEILRDPFDRSSIAK